MPHSTAIKISGHLEPDVLAPFEYSTTYQRRDQLLPEIKLMFAVLTSAIECLQKYSGAKSRRCRKMFAEAEAWIFGSDSLALYSFEHVCEALQLDPSYLRLGLKRWRDGMRVGHGTQKRIRAPLRYQRRL